MNNLAGQLLIASPYLPDPNFLRTVVLMVQHDTDGALGLVLTRPMNLTVQEVWENVSQEKIDAPEPVFQGGPVEGPIMAVHDQMDLCELEIVPGVYFSSEKESIENLVEREPKSYRLFLGYSGWAPQQLDEEMRVGGWLTLPAESDHVFELDSEVLWKQVTAKVGTNVMQQSLNLKKMPQDPFLN